MASGKLLLGFWARVEYLHIISYILMCIMIATLMTQLAVHLSNWWYFAVILRSAAHALHSSVCRFRKTRKPGIIVPFLPLTFIVSYLGDMAYGTKMKRIRGEMRWWSCALADPGIWNGGRGLSLPCPSFPFPPSLPLPLPFAPSLPPLRSRLLKFS